MYIARDTIAKPTSIYPPLSLLSWYHRSFHCTDNINRLRVDLALVGPDSQVLSGCWRNLHSASNVDSSWRNLDDDYRMSYSPNMPAQSLAVCCALFFFGTISQKNQASLLSTTRQNAMKSRGPWATEYVKYTTIIFFCANGINF